MSLKRPCLDSDKSSLDSDKSSLDSDKSSLESDKSSLESYKSSLESDMSSLESTVRPHVECPVCYEVPRDGVMLQCVNGHNVCAVCKNHMGDDVKCPQGRCAFGTPPSRNFTVAAIVENLDFEWPCKNRPTEAEVESEAGCQFRGNRQALASHESVCTHRTIPCPLERCRGRMGVDCVVPHFVKWHKAQMVANESDATHVNVWLRWKRDLNPANLQNFSWYASMSAGDVGWVLLCSHFKDGHLLAWPWVLLDAAEAKTFDCWITVSSPDVTLSFRSDVYPVSDWSRPDVLRDGKYAAFSARNIERALTDERVSDADKADGFAKVKIVFRFARKKSSGGVKRVAENDLRK